MKRILLLICCGLLLTGCTDIRTRLLPDILAVDLHSPLQFAAHTSQETGIISAEAETALQMPDALRNASGAEISTGHLTMLAVSGNPCGIVEAYFQEQMLAPTCAVLSVPADACALLRSGGLPEPEMLEAAAETGLLPCRTADAILADLWGGSGITAVCTADTNGLTLALWTESECCGVLSADACRGLALLGKRRRSFAFAAAGSTYRLISDALQIRITQDDRLHIAVTGTVRTAPSLTQAASDRLTEMLHAALDETACAAGADLLFLREHAIRCKISDARSCTQSAWRGMLQSAEYTVALN